MLIPIQNFSGSDPNTAECRTEHIVNDFSRCLSNNAHCKYAIPAGFTSTYCLHPNHRDFEDAALSGTCRDAMTYPEPRGMKGYCR